MMNLVEINRKEFATFSDENAGSFLQSAEMAQLLESRGYQVYFVALKSERTIVAAALVTAIKVMGGQKMEVNFGPLFSNKECDETAFTSFVSGLKTFAKAHKAIELIVRPNENYETFTHELKSRSDKNESFIKKMTALGFTHAAFAQGYESQEATAEWQYLKDLSALTEEELPKSYTKDGAYFVKKAKSFGIKIRNLKYDELDKFKELTEAAANYHHFQDKELSYYQLFYKTFGDKAEFLVAEINVEAYEKALKRDIATLEEKLNRSSSLKKAGQRREFESQIASHKQRLASVKEMVASHLHTGGGVSLMLSGAVFISNKQETLYFLSGTLEKYRKFYAPYLIQDEMMRRSIQKGTLTYNFYGISGILDGSDSILHFKQAFNGYVVHKVGKFCYYPQPLKYQTIRFGKKLLKR